MAAVYGSFRRMVQAVEKSLRAPASPVSATPGQFTEVLGWDRIGNHP